MGTIRRKGKIAAILPWDAHSNKSTLNLRRTAGQGRRTQPIGRPRERQLGCVTAAANLTKKSSAVFFAALLIRRWPSWASLPPICASTS
jgi:hypothetical protein